MSRIENIKKEIEARKAGMRRSPLEEQAIHLLSGVGVDGVPEFQVGNYLIDIALPDLKIAIELDGDTYHLSKERAEKDRQKDQFLRDSGWTVIRERSSSFWQTRGVRLVEAVLAAIQNANNMTPDAAAWFNAQKSLIGNFGAEIKREEDSWSRTLRTVDWCPIRKGYYDGYGNVRYANTDYEPYLD